MHWTDAKIFWLERILSKYNSIYLFSYFMSSFKAFQTFFHWKGKPNLCPILLWFKFLTSFHSLIQLNCKFPNFKPIKFEQYLYSKPKNENAIFGTVFCFLMWLINFSNNKSFLTSDIYVSCFNFSVGIRKLTHFKTGFHNSKQTSKVLPFKKISHVSKQLPAILQIKRTQLSYFCFKICPTFFDKLNISS